MLALFIGINMIKALSEELKDIQIKQILEDYHELQKTISQIPNDLSASMELISNAINILPEKIDNKIQDKISNIIEFAETAEKLAEQEANNQIYKFKNDAEEVKTEILKNFIITLQKEVRINISELNNVTNEIKKQAKKEKSNIPFILVCFLSVVLSFVGGFAGVGVWNKVYLDAEKIKAEASIHGYMESLKILPAEQAKKVNEVYIREADKVLNEK